MSENQGLSLGLLEGATSFLARFTGSSLPRQEHIDASVGTESNKNESVEEREFHCSIDMYRPLRGWPGSGLKPLVNKFVVYPIEDFHGPCRVNNPPAV